MRSLPSAGRPLDIRPDVRRTIAIATLRRRDSGCVQEALAFGFTEDERRGSSQVRRGAAPAVAVRDGTADAQRRRCA
jgi:hypothetical protein